MITSHYTFNGLYSMLSPGGALFWRNAGKHHLANYELKPETAIDGS
jgi:hypothetical protein